MKKNNASLVLLLLITLVFVSVPLRAQLVNPNATAETKKLKTYLDWIYGKKILSGQVDDKYLQYIKDATGGKSPAIMGYDFNGITPSQGGNSDAQKAIDWVKNKGGIAQFQWHWISPNADGDFYTTNYKLSAALADTTSASYKNLIRDIDLVAASMKKMQDAGVPILWRPLHEAEGKWFWWGMSGGTACKQLYRLMYDRFVNYHKLNNLIWIWNSYGTTKENWYPGDDVVDIIAWDYPDYGGASSWNQYQQMFGAKGKLFGVGEDGKLTDPLTFQSQPWLYFLTWAYMIQDNNSKDWISKVYNDPRVVTLDDLKPGPKAFAGTNRLLFDNDGDGVESVTLDASGSYTDRGSIVAYSWKENNIEIGVGVTPSVKLKLGVHPITLTVTTDLNETAISALTISIGRPTLSLNRDFRASSTEVHSLNVGANAVDGNPSTHWTSSSFDPQWYLVILDKPYDIRQVVLNWDVNSAKDYRIDVSVNGVAWTTVLAKTNMPAGARLDTLDTQGAQARYVRMFGTARTTTNGYSINEFELYGSPSVTVVDADRNVPSGFYLHQNYPNPFNPSTVIEYGIPHVSNVTISVCNAIGQTVAVIADGVQAAGTHTVRFAGQALPSGLYFYAIEADGLRQVRKMQLLK